MSIRWVVSCSRYWWNCIQIISMWFRCCSYSWMSVSECGLWCLGTVSRSCLVSMAWNHGEQINFADSSHHVEIHKPKLSRSGGQPGTTAADSTKCGLTDSVVAFLMCGSGEPEMMKLMIDSATGMAYWVPADAAVTVAPSNMAPITPYRCTSSSSCPSSSFLMPAFLKKRGWTVVLIRR